MTKSHNQSPNAGTLPVCVKCQRQTRIQAVLVLPIEMLVDVRCEECGCVWTIRERRAPRETEVKSPSDSSAPKTDEQTSHERDRMLIQQQHQELAQHQHRSGRY